MYAKFIYNIMYYIQCIYDYVDNQKIELLGPLNVVSINLYDFENVQKKSIYHQSYIQFICALFYKFILKNEQKYKSCLLWEEHTVFDPSIYNIQATQLLEIKFANHDVSYVRNDKVHHVPQDKQRSLVHCVLVSIANLISSNPITFLLNQVFPLNLTVKEFISLVYLKNMMNKDILLRALLRQGLLLRTVTIDEFDIKEHDYKDNQVILHAT